MTVKTYLANLTTRNAAVLFFASLLLGIVDIGLGFGLPWVPGVIVAVYGGALLYAEKECLVSHTEITNNSPYFLGFLYFLLALLVTFRSFSLQSADYHLDYLIRQLGSALLPTIVGLSFRQLLFAFSRTQADQDLFFRTLEDELRRSATEFRRSQAELVQLVQEFAETRKVLFYEEEKAARKYVHNLERATALFDESLTNYPAIISSALSNCAQSLHGVKEKLRELNQAAEQINPRQLSDFVTIFDSAKNSAGNLASELASLKTVVEHFRVLAGTVSGSIKDQISSANLDINEVRKELRAKVEGIQVDLIAIDKVLSDFVDVAQGRIESIR